MKISTVKQLTPAMRGEIIWLLKSGFTPEAIIVQKAWLPLFVVKAVGRANGILK